MHVAAQVLVGLVAVIHFYILVLEMFLWTTPRGLKAFDLEPEFAEASKSLAANQGLYNGFLAAGLVWGLIDSRPAEIFFLVCVIVAGLYGAVTATRKTLFIQVLPAAIALVFVLLAG